MSTHKPRKVLGFFQDIETPDGKLCVRDEFIQIQCCFLCKFDTYLLIFLLFSPFIEEWRWISLDNFFGGLCESYPDQDSPKIEYVRKAEALRIKLAPRMVLLSILIDNDWIIKIWNADWTEEHYTSDNSRFHNFNNLALLSYNFIVLFLYFVLLFFIRHFLYWTIFKLIYSSSKK